MQQPQMIDKLHNIVWRCAMCEAWHTSEDKMQMISMIAGFQGERTGIRAMMQAIPVDEKCFKEFNLKEEKLDIVIPKPGQIKNALNLGRFQ